MEIELMYEKWKSALERCGEANDELQALREREVRYREAAEKAEKFISVIMQFYGQNLSVYNWHQNGDGEHWDNFFDENMDGDELDLLRKALIGNQQEGN